MSSSPQSLASHPAERQPRPTIALHWLSALAILVAIGAALTREALDAETARRWLQALHQQAGLLVLLLLPMRWLARALFPKAAVTREPSAALRWAAAATHVLMYGLLLSLPFLGWALANAQGHPAALFGLIPLPSLVATDPDLAESLDDWHARLAWGLVAMVVMHAAAALWHHFIRRDDTLRGMLPARLDLPPGG
jgi:cytochrome b561